MSIINNVLSDNFEPRKIDIKREILALFDTFPLLQFSIFGYVIWSVRYSLSGQAAYIEVLSSKMNNIQEY